MQRDALPGEGLPEELRSLKDLHVTEPLNQLEVFPIFSDHSHVAAARTCGNKRIKRHTLRLTLVETTQFLLLLLRLWVSQNSTLLANIQSSSLGTISELSSR